jgi:predicted nucleic acid-binding protein
VKIRIDKAVITDANILIDYMEAGKKIISLFASSVEALYVPLTVLKEVPKLNAAEAGRLGLKILDTEWSLIAEALSIKTGCSFNDNICYLTAKRGGFICATNDKRLRKVCESGSVEVLWGLQIMIYLVQQGKLSNKDAVEVARKIEKINSNFTRALVEDFELKINCIKSL